MEQKPAGDYSGGAPQQPEIILSPTGASTPPIPNRVCPNCGTLNPPQSVYCFKCGIKLPDAALLNKKICAGCHAPNAPTAHYCYKCGLSLPENLSSGYEYQIQYAGFWMRLAAYLIDGIILGIISSMIYIPLLIHYFGSSSDYSWLYSLETNGTFDSSSWTIYWLLLLSIYAIQIIYYTVTVGKWGRTIGKAALRIKVVKADGSRVSYGRAFGRSLAYYLNGFTLDIGFLIIAFTKEKRGLHDYIADTIVIKTD
jgi:uncharacterized RDD family membrane protein YckC/ribosomal protein L40E